MVNCGFKHQLMVKRETLSSSTDGNWTINKWGVDKQNLLFYKEKGDYEPTRVDKIRLKNYKKQKGWGDHRFWISMSDPTPVLCAAVTFGKDDQSWSWIPSKLVESRPVVPVVPVVLDLAVLKLEMFWVSIPSQSGRTSARTSRPSCSKWASASGFVWQDRALDGRPLSWGKPWHVGESESISGHNWGISYGMIWYTIHYMMLYVCTYIYIYTYIHMYADLEHNSF